MKKLLIMIMAGLVCVAQARLIIPYSPAELNAAADTVVIIQAVSTEKINEQPDFTKMSGLPKESYQAWLTTFEVVTVFRGKAAEGKALKVVHFGYSELASVVNGSQFIKFIESSGKPSTKGRPCWLAYLKRRADGYFEPAKGQYDGEFSFSELIPPGPRFH